MIDSGDAEAWIGWFEERYGEVISGDADLDGDVDSEDLNQLAIHWRQPDAGWLGGDFDHNGVTDPVDLNEIGINWQRGVAAATSVPEPNMNGILLLLIVSFVTKCTKRG